MRTTPDIGETKPEPPLFTIISRGPLTLVDKETGAGVRPCRHPRYVLDDEWMTVTCAECKERLEPYAILRFNAGVIEEIQRERRQAQWAEESLLAASCRELLRRSCFSDDERESLTRRTHVHGKDTLGELRTLHKQLAERVRDAKALRRARKRLRNAGGVR